MLKRVLTIGLLAAALIVPSVVWVVPKAVATFTTTAPRNDYTGNGATAIYAYTFRIFEATDLKVSVRTTDGVESTLTYPTDYTVSGVGAFSGGFVTLTAGNLANGYALTIRFGGGTKQPVDLRNQGGFFPQSVEDALDRLGRYIQKNEDVVSRALHLQETEAGTDAKTTLPTATDRASKYLAFDASGNPIAASTITSGVTASSYMQTVLDDTTAAAARTTLGAVGLTGNETVAGDKTLSGAVVANGAVTVNGGGITFPATQVAGADANTLDDYEEGSWTPSLGGTATYTTRSGSYTKIGRVVYLRGTLQVNAIGTGSSGTVSGLPCTANANDYGVSLGSYSGVINNVTGLYGRVNASNATMTFFGAAAAAAANTGVSAIFGNSTAVTFTAWYEAASCP